MAAAFLLPGYIVTLLLTRTLQIEGNNRYVLLALCHHSVFKRITIRPSIPNTASSEGVLGRVRVCWGQRVYEGVLGRGFLRISKLWLFHIYVF